jgi:AcrR family transcriptional regulator
MTERPAVSIRSRVRAEMIESIKTIARAQLAEVGAANLSLRAVARELGVVSSALYRYFASRDDLLTALIIDAYDALGEAAESADARLDRAELRGRWLAICHAVRDWALAHPHEYALIYGSPVPGYRAPTDTVGPAQRGVLALGSILRDGVAAGRVSEPTDGRRPPAAVGAELTRVRDLAFPGIPVGLMARGIAAWIQVLGTVSFELFGQFNNVFADRAAHFDYQMNVVADRLGL